jgi:AcrR family transcriptional regulator
MATVAKRASAGSERSVRVPQQARSRRTRERILEAATACFEQHGYDDTTTAMIAARARIGVGTLYGYFRDKRAILFELLDRVSDQLQEIVVSRLDPEHWQGDDPAEHARQLIDAVFHLQTLRPGVQRVLWERYFKDPDFHEPMEGVRERLRQAVEDFARAIDPAQLRDGLDLHAASLTVVNAVQWNALHAFMHGSDEQIDAAAAATADMVARYLFRD